MCLRECVSGVLTVKFMSSKVYEQEGGSEKTPDEGLTSRWKLILNPWGWASHLTTRVRNRAEDL